MVGRQEGEVTSARLSLLEVQESSQRHKVCDHTGWERLADALAQPTVTN